jgi:hypothetical protein
MRPSSEREPRVHYPKRKRLDNTGDPDGKAARKSDLPACDDTDFQQ